MEWLIGSFADMEWVLIVFILAMVYCTKIFCSALGDAAKSINTLAASNDRLKTTLIEMEIARNNFQRTKETIENQIACNEPQKLQDEMVAGTNLSEFRDVPITDCVFTVDKPYKL